MRTSKECFPQFRLILTKCMNFLISQNEPDTRLATQFVLHVRCSHTEEASHLTQGVAELLSYLPSEEGQNSRQSLS
mgnify:CR=1 FL=1